MAKVSVCIDVADARRGQEFYTQALGCELVKEGDEYTELKTEGLTIYLSQQEAGSNAVLEGEAIRTYRRHWTPVHLDFTVTDLPACVASIIKLGGSKEGEKSGEWGQAAFCADPFGNGFCVLQFN